MITFKKYYGRWRWQKWHKGALPYLTNAEYTVIRFAIGKDIACNWLP